MFEEWRLETQERVSFRKHNSKRKLKLNKRNKIVWSLEERSKSSKKDLKNDEKMPKFCHYLIMIFVMEFCKNLKNVSARSSILIWLKNQFLLILVKMFDIIVKENEEKTLNIWHIKCQVPQGLFKFFNPFVFFLKARFSHFSSTNNFLEGIKFHFPPNFKDLQKTYLVDENCLTIT